MLNFSKFIINESRRNPDQNPKISVIEVLKQYKDRSDIYVSFTNVDKIGINPTSHFGTPNGIYTYPLKEAWNAYIKPKERSGLELSMLLPFAGDRPHLWILKGRHSSGFVEDLYKDYDSSRYDADLTKLKEIIGKDLLDKIALSKADPLDNSVAGRFWSLTWAISVNRDCQKILGSSHSGHAWSNLLRRMNYTGFGDKTGRGIIHEIEPLQAFFLSTKEFTVVEKVVNRVYAIKDPR